MIIKSVSNQNYKLINRLKNKKYREKENLFIIESRKLVDEAISSSANIDFIFLRSDVSYETDFESLVFALYPVPSGDNSKDVVVSPKSDTQASKF